MDSLSDETRNIGNEYYKKYTKNQYQLINQSNLTTAIKYYEEAFKLSRTFEEKYKEQKNIGLSYEKLMETYDFGTKYQ